MAFGHKAPIRFREIFTQKTGSGAHKILLDVVTGVQYYYIVDGYNHCGGLTPLLGPDGRPVLLPPELFPKDE